MSGSQLKRLHGVIYTTSSGVVHNTQGKACLFVCGISSTSSQLINELFPDCLKGKGGESTFPQRHCTSCSTCSKDVHVPLLKKRDRIEEQKGASSREPTEKPTTSVDIDSDEEMAAENPDVG